MYLGLSNQTQTPCGQTVWSLDVTVLDVDLDTETKVIHCYRDPASNICRRPALRQLCNS